MKQFFEQYGGVALGILALLVLIAMITPVGNIIKTSLQGTVQTFSSSINAQTVSMSDSMSATFINATDFTGVKNDRLYVNGVIPNFLKNYTVSTDGTKLINNNTGKESIVVIDLNRWYNNNYYTQEGSLTELTYKIYTNNALTAFSVADYTATVSLKDDYIFKVELSDSAKEKYIQTDGFEYTLEDALIEQINRTSDDYVLGSYFYIGISPVAFDK